MRPQVAGSVTAANIALAPTRVRRSGYGSGPTALCRISRSTRWGWRAAIATAVGPPPEVPITAATLVTPRCAHSVRVTSANPVTVVPVDSGVRPYPGREGARIV